MENSPKSPEAVLSSYDEQKVGRSNKDVWDDVDLILNDPQEYIRIREQELREIGYIKEDEERVDNKKHVTALETASRQEVNGRTVFSVPAIIRGFKARRR